MKMARAIATIIATTKGPKIKGHTYLSSVMDRRMRHTSASTILGTVELGNHDVELLGRLLADVSDDGVPKRDT